MKTSSAPKTLAFVFAATFIPALESTPRPVSSGSKFVDAADAAKLHFQYGKSPTPNKYLIETMGGGVAVLDFDGDGWLDVFFVNGAALGDPQPENPPPDKSAPAYWNRLFRNNRDGTFSDVTERASVQGHGYGMGVAAGDYDNDGFPDLFVTNYGPSILYHNQGNGTFRDVTSQSGLRTEGWNMSAGFLDYDNDGYLDLFVTRYLQWNFAIGAMVCGPNIPGGRAYCHPNEFQAISNYLFRNNRDGTFTDVSEASKIKANEGYGLGLAFGDYNNDGRVDIYVANDAFPQFLFRNRGDGTFSEEAALAGVGYTEDGNTFSGMGTDFVDLDNDGFLDLITTALPYEYFALFHNNGDGSFAYASVTSNLAEISRAYGGWGIRVADFDNDGENDVFIATSHVMDNIEVTQPHLRYLQQPRLLTYRGKKFADVSTAAGEPFHQPWAARGAAFGDLDNDGDVDIVVSDYQHPAHLLRNDGGNQNHWIELDLQGTKSNRDALGARVKLTSGSGRIQHRTVSTAGSYASANDRRVALGIGSETTIKQIHIRWPSGTEQTIDNPKPDQILRLVEPSTSGPAAEAQHMEAGRMPEDPSPLVSLQQGARAQSHYESGLALLRQGKFDAAVQAFRAAIQLQPDSVDAHYALGVALSRMGSKRLPEAVDEFLQALRLQPDHVDVRVDLSSILAQQGDHHAAAAQLESALRLAPKNPDLHILLGKTQLDCGEFPKAVRSFRTALELNARLSAPHYGIGLALAKQHDPEGAAQEFRAALELNANDSYSYLELGKIALEKGDLPGAAKHLNEAIRLRPGTAEAHLELGKLHRRANALDKADAAYREALRLQPGLGEALYQLGLLLRSEGKLDQAKELFAQFEKLQLAREAPGKAHAFNADGMKLADEGRFNEALEVFEKALDADPSFFMAAYNRGIVFSRMGKKQEAIEAFRAATRLRPDFVLGHYALGLMLKSVGDPSAEAELAKSRLLNQYVAQPLGRRDLELSDPQ